MNALLQSQRPYIGGVLRDVGVGCIIAYSVATANYDRRQRHKYFERAPSRGILLTGVLALFAGALLGGGSHAPTRSLAGTGIDVARRGPHRVGAAEHLIPRGAVIDAEVIG